MVEDFMVVTYPQNCVYDNALAQILKEMHIFQLCSRILDHSSLCDNDELVHH